MEYVAFTPEETFNQVPAGTHPAERFLLHSTSANAQFGKVEMNMFDHDSKPYYFGITIGINLARFHTEWHPVFCNQIVY